MVLKFHGTIERLCTIVNGCGIEGVWRDIEKSNQYQFKAASGENMNWWPQTGTINFQGGSTKILEMRMRRALTANPSAEQGVYQKPTRKKKIAQNQKKTASRMA